MQLQRGKFCPLIQGDCKELACCWFTQLRGSNPQTGDPVDEWACAVTWTPILLVESTQAQKQTGAAVESFRNEAVEGKAIKLRSPRLARDGG